MNRYKQNGLKKLKIMAVKKLLNCNKEHLQIVSQVLYMKVRTLFASPS